MRVNCLRLIVLILFFAPRVTNAQESNRDRPQPMSNEFVRASLKALKTIDGESGWAIHRGDGQVTVPRETQESVDNADIEARRDGEKEIVAILNRLFHLKMVINAHRDDILNSPIGVDPASGSYVPLSKEERKRRASTDPDIAKMDAARAICSSALDALLRSGTYERSPEECSKHSLRQIPIASDGGSTVRDNILE